MCSTHSLDFNSYNTLLDFDKSRQTQNYRGENAQVRRISTLGYHGNSSWRLRIHSSYWVVLRYNIVCAATACIAYNNIVHSLTKAVLFDRRNLVIPRISRPHCGSAVRQAWKPGWVTMDDSDRCGKVVLEVLGRTFYKREKNEKKNNFLINSNLIFIFYSNKKYSQFSF